MTEMTYEDRIAEIHADWDDDTGAGTLEDAVREWANCRHAEVHPTGEVYVEDPQEGHYLRDDDLRALLDWLREREEVSS